MYTIGICDDIPSICTQIEETILHYGHSEGELFKIDIFHSGEEVLEHFESGRELDLLFLDIELKELNGVELGRKIRSEFMNETTQIVYISAKESYAMDLFQVRPMNFLVKPIKQNAIVSMVKQAMALNAGSDYFCYKTGRDFHRQNIRDILYFESHGRQIRMVTRSGEVIFYDKMNDVQKRLKENLFIPIHKSITINYRHIRDFYYDRIVISNGETLSISQSRRKKVRALQLEYERKYGK